MAVLKWLIAGLVGAGIGGAIWVAVGYFANMEVGYIAWGIGLLAGLGVRRTMQPAEVNAASGIASVAAALLVIALSKYYVVHLHVNDVLGAGVVEQPADPVEYVADDIIKERMDAGQEIKWPEGEGTADDAEVFAYPEDILAEARTRWEAKPEVERTEYAATKHAERIANMEAMRGVIRDQVFKGSFGPYDLLWFGLAMLTAFKVGRGAGSETPTVTEPDAPTGPPGSPPDASQPPTAQA